MKSLTIVDDPYFVPSKNNVAENIALLGGKGFLAGAVTLKMNKPLLNFLINQVIQIF